MALPQNAAGFLTLLTAHVTQDNPGYHARSRLQPPLTVEALGDGNFRLTCGAAIRQVCKTPSGWVLLDRYDVDGQQVFTTPNTRRGFAQWLSDLRLAHAPWSKTCERTAT